MQIEPPAHGDHLALTGLILLDGNVTRAQGFLTVARGCLGVPGQHER